MKRAIHLTWTHRVITVFILAISGGFFSAYGMQVFPAFLQTEISMEKNGEISPDSPIVINFSRAVQPKSYDGKIKIIPWASTKLEWKESGKKLVITPDRFWKPESRYAISLGGGQSRFFLTNNPISFNFSTVDYPRVANFTPADGSKNVLLDIEDPIVVDLNKSANNFFVKFDLTPPVEVAYENNSEKTQFRLLPKGQIKEGQKYEVKISAKYADDKDDSYREIYTSGFETLPPKPKAWDKNFSVRIEQAKTYTRAKILDGKYIDINLSAQILSIFENGKILDSYLISSGKRDMETPRGTHAIANKFPRAWSNKYGLFMPYWMAITPSGSYGIHELPEWPGGYKEGANHLGIPVSHGCVRLGIGPAKRVYEWAGIGTPVVVY